MFSVIFLGKVAESIANNCVATAFVPETKVGATQQQSSMRMTFSIWAASNICGQIILLSLLLFLVSSKTYIPNKTDVS